MLKLEIAKYLEVTTCEYIQDVKFYKVRTFEAKTVCIVLVHIY